MQEGLGRIRQWVNDHHAITTTVLLVLVIFTRASWWPWASLVGDWIIARPSLMAATATLSLAGFAAVELWLSRSERRLRERAANAQIGAEAHLFSLEIMERLAPMLQRSHGTGEYREILLEMRPAMLNMVRLAAEAPARTSEVLIRAFSSYSQLYIGAGRLSKEEYKDVLVETVAALALLIPKKLEDAWAEVRERESRDEPSSATREADRP